MTSLITVTIAVPAALISDARQLARCVGYGAEDEETFRTPSWQDAEGNLYAVASGPVWPAFLAVPGQTLVPPAWGADMEAAGRAHAVLAVSDLRAQEDEPVTATPAGPTHIAAVIGPEGSLALDMLGLTPVPPPEE